MERQGSPAYRLGELEQVVGGADHRPLASDLIEAPQEELPEAPGLLHLPEHRLDHLLSQVVSTAPARSLQPLGHRAHQRCVFQPATSSGMGLAVPRAAWGQVASDPTLLQCRQVRLGGKAGVP